MINKVMKCNKENTPHLKRTLTIGLNQVNTCFTFQQVFYFATLWICILLVLATFIYQSVLYFFTLYTKFECFSVWVCYPQAIVFMFNGGSSCTSTIHPIDTKRCTVRPSIIGQVCKNIETRPASWHLALYYTQASSECLSAITMNHVIGYENIHEKKSHRP